jgi:hypothetical protein
MALQHRPGWVYAEEKAYHEVFHILVVLQKGSWWVYMLGKGLDVPGERPFHHHGFRSRFAAMAWGEAWARLLGREETSW